MAQNATYRAHGAAMVCEDRSMTSDDLEVRRATLADVGDVAPLFALYREFYGKPFDEPAAATFLRDRLGNDESVVLLAELDSRLVGFTQLYPGFSSVSAAPAWTLNDLYVLEAARGSGAATALMEHAETLARQPGRCTSPWRPLEPTTSPSGCTCGRGTKWRTATCTMRSTCRRVGTKSSPSHLG